MAKAVATAATISPHPRPAKPSRSPAGRAVGSARTRRDTAAAFDGEIVNAATDGEPPDAGPVPIADPSDGEPDCAPVSSGGEVNAGEPSTATAAPPSDRVTLACGPRASCCRPPVTCWSDPVVSF